MITISSNSRMQFNGETNTEEYKTSFIFSSDPKKPGRDHQMYVIFKAICAFLNAEGGTLYLGVNDDGKVVGLKNDISELHDPRVKNLDSYSRYIYDRCRDYIKDFESVKDLIEVNPVPEQGYIEIMVSKCPDFVVRMVKDNVAYQRSGTRSQKMNDDMISRRERLLADRKAERRRMNKDGRFCNILLQAIREKRKVRIIKYQSGNSGTIRDRILEPINFLSNGDCIWCYEKESDNSHLKQFKLSRMTDVEILDEAWEHESEHKTGSTDVFGWNGCEAFDVSMTLNVTAHNMMIEQFPKTDNDSLMIDYGDGTWYFKASVHNLDPVVRFCAGWLDQIQIWSEDLRDEVRRFLQTTINSSLEQQYVFA